VTATDISGNGCYVESMLPFPPGTHLRAQLCMGTERLTTSAVVRTCDQGLGMDIEFMTLTTEQQDEVQRHLQRLNPGDSTLLRTITTDLLKGRLAIRSSS
jgi:PilZ domain